MGIINRKFLDECPDSSTVPAICNVPIIKQGDARAQVRVLDAEALLEISLDVEEARKTAKEAMRAAFGDIYSDTLTNIYDDHLSAIVAHKGISAVQDDDVESFLSKSIRSWERKQHGNVQADCIRPWFTMIAVLWQGDKIFGFRLYDWLLDTAADYDAASVIEQVKNKTVKITNLDWLQDSFAKEGELRCTQGLYEDYTRLDIAGRPLGKYRPLVILGYTLMPPQESDTMVNTLVDYQGNIIYANQHRLSKESAKTQEGVRDLVLTRGIANAVIVAAQNIVDYRKEIQPDLVTVTKNKFSELLDSKTISAISALELEPFQQTANSSDTFQSVLGYISYKCRGNVYKRVDWATQLAEAKNLIISTLMTVYDPVNNQYIQVPYIAMHTALDRSVEHRDAVSCQDYGIFRLATTLSYKDTYYPVLARKTPQSIYDNLGREVLVTTHMLGDFKEKIDDIGSRDMQANYIQEIEHLIMQAETGNQIVAKTDIANDKGIVNKVDLYSFTAISPSLFNPGVCLPLSRYDCGGTVINWKYRNQGRSSYEIDAGAPILYFSNTAITANLFKINSNISKNMAMHILTSSDGGAKFAEYGQFYITVPQEQKFYALDEMCYGYPLTFFPGNYTLMLSGTNGFVEVSRADGAKPDNLNIKLVLKPTSTICLFQPYIRNYKSNLEAEGIVSDSVECIQGNEFNWSNKDITLPDSIQILGRECFKDSGIKKIKLPANLKAIGTGCFALCEKITSIELPEGLEIIGAQAFSACVSLKEIVIPASVKIIYSKAFSDCENLTDIVFLGDPLIADDAFSNCQPQIEGKAYNNHTIYKANSNSIEQREKIKARCNIYQ